MPNSRVWLLFGALVPIVAAVSVFFATAASGVPFAYDEADYMYAGTRGVTANFLDRDAIPFSEYVRKGVELVRHPEERASISRFVRSSGDLSFYRHYHGPVYAYWLALWHAFGARSEVTYRASGIPLHALAALALFWLFLMTFPEYPPEIAFFAALLFVMNRTALLAATFITQHVIFEVLSLFTLFAVALFFRTGELRWWYLTAVLAAAEFATVEIAVVLMTALLLSLVLLRWKDGIGRLAGLVARGAAWFLLTLVVLWPKGLLQLNALKGYLYLAYMAIQRKTFSPISATELWVFRLKTYPLEFVLPFAAMLAGVWLIRRPKARPTLVPFVCYAVLFFLVTLKVTAPFTYYHASLMSTLAVVTGCVLGEIWRRAPATARMAIAALVVVPLVWLDAGFHREKILDREAPSLAADVLKYTRSYTAQADVRTVFLPFDLVPTMHYYLPNIPVTGYDTDWTNDRLAGESLQASPDLVLCRESTCMTLERLWPEGAVVHRAPVSRTPSGEPLNAIGLTDPGHH
ncbi:MAG: hypothetical protein ABSH49_26250 [Bryobacteraceae bacterium]|jgi:hypothetical protein